jgi:hypothetical protein
MRMKMAERDDSGPNAQLYEHLDPWFEAVDEALTELDTPLPDRPMRALMQLLQSDVMDVGFGDKKVDLSRPWDHAGETWFRVLYVGAERWYERTYGAEAIRGRGNAPLEGVVMVRSVPFAMKIPAHRHKVTKDGEEAWMHFEEGLGEGEKAIDWIHHGPDLKLLDGDKHAEVEALATRVARALRFMHFRRIGIRGKEAEGLAETCAVYVRDTARQIVSTKSGELSNAWLDLHMAMETALKLVLQLKEGGYPHHHKLNKLLETAATHGVVSDAARIAAWPDFKAISNYRYGKGEAFERRDLFDAYLLMLDLVVAAMSVIKPPYASGFGLLLRRPPWLYDAPVRAGETG